MRLPQGQDGTSDQTEVDDKVRVNKSHAFVAAWSSALQQSLNTIWDVPPRPSSRRWGLSLRQKLIGFGAVASVGFLFGDPAGRHDRNCRRRNIFQRLASGAGSRTPTPQLPCVRRNHHVSICMPVPISTRPAHRVAEGLGWRSGHSDAVRGWKVG